MNNKQINRPKFCLDELCEILVSSYSEGDLAEGYSFECFGKLKEENIFKEKDIIHKNNISHCRYTPLKGMLRFFENINDIQGQIQVQLRVMEKLIECKCPTCGGKLRKVWGHLCLDCGEKT